MKKSCVLTLPFILIQLLGTSAPTQAQRMFIAPVTANIAEYYGDSDTTFRVVIAYGATIDSIFHPDTALHHYRQASVDNSNFTLQSPEEGTFRGYDTLIVTCGQYEIGTATLSLSIDYRGAISTTMSRSLINYVHPDLNYVGGYAQLQIGASGCFDYYTLRNDNSIPITISSARFSTTDALTLSSLGLPKILRPQETMTFRFCAAAPRTVDTLRGDLQVVVLGSSSIRDTLERTVTLQVVPLYPYDCIIAGYASVLRYPWNPNSDTTIYLTNRQGTAVTVTGIRQLTADSDYFSITTHRLPFEIAAGATDSVTVAMHLPADSSDHSYQAEFRFDLAGRDSNNFPCPATYTSVFANAKNDFLKERNSLFSQHYTSVFQSFGQIIQKELHIWNNGLTSVTLEGATLAGSDSSYWSVLHMGFARGYNLAPGDSTTIYLEFPTGPIEYRHFSATLDIHLGDGSTPSIPLNGIIYDLSVSPDQSASNANLQIHPNPASSSFIFDIQNASEYNLEIVSADGARIYAANTLRSSTLSQAMLPTKLAPGVYFIRIDGIDTMHRHFVLTKRLSIIR